MNDNIEQILKMNLTAEQKEALLGQLANGIIKEQSAEKSWKKQNEELISRNRTKADETRQRQKERERTRELERKEQILSEITNAQGEKIYSNLSDMSGYEIESLYDTYSRLNPSKLEEAKKLYETQKIAEGSERLKDEMLNKEKSQTEIKETKEDENEIVSERDGEHITKKAGFKEKLKKILKTGIALGLAGLLSANIYINSKAPSSKEAESKPQPQPITWEQMVNTGETNTIYESNDNAKNSINALNPSEKYYQNEILGYTTSDNVIHDASNMQNIIDSYENGEEVTSVVTGDKNGIDGFVNKADGIELQELLKNHDNYKYNNGYIEQLQEGGKTR